MISKRVLFGCISILVFPIILIAQNEYANDQIIVNMHEQYTELSLHINERGIAMTGIASIDQLCDQYECISIRKIYEGPNPSAAGIYFYQLSVRPDSEEDSRTVTKKMLLLK